MGSSTSGSSDSHVFLLLGQIAHCFVFPAVNNEKNYVNFKVFIVFNGPTSYEWCQNEHELYILNSDKVIKLGALEREALMHMHLMMKTITKDCRDTLAQMPL